MFLALKTSIKSKNSPYVGPNSLLHNELPRSDPGGDRQAAVRFVNYEFFSYYVFSNPRSIQVNIRILIIGIAGILSFAANASDDAIDEISAGAGNNVILADNKRPERRDDRQDNRDDKQDCRQDEGRVGDDKRDCKQENRGEDDDEKEGAEAEA